MENSYYLLRHGRNIHQTELKDICYGWPDDDIPCKLDEVGIKQAILAGEKLKDFNIDLIFSSPVLRTKQTAEIVANILGITTICFDKRLRDMNWGVFAGGPKQRVYEYYSERDLMYDAPEKGESWSELQKRVVSVIKDIEGEYKNKNVLIVSHGDPILLLKAFYNKWGLDEILKEKKNIKVGEFHELRRKNT